jgi:hypothetical protein
MMTARWASVSVRQPAVPAAVEVRGQHRLWSCPPVYPNIAAGMKPTAVNQLWVADITYIRLDTEFVYLSGDPGCVLPARGGLGVWTGR